MELQRILSLVINWENMESSIYLLSDMVLKRIKSIKSEYTSVKMKNVVYIQLF